MTKRMTTAELHVVMYQSIGGKETQRAPIADRELWCCHNPYVDGWDTTNWIYRVKPEPREPWEGWVVLERAVGRQREIFDDLVLAREYAEKNYLSPDSIVHVREVLEGE